MLGSGSDSDDPDTADLEIDAVDDEWDDVNDVFQYVDQDAEAEAVGMPAEAESVQGSSSTKLIGRPPDVVIDEEEFAQLVLSNPEMLGWQVADHFGCNLDRVKRLKTKLGLPPPRRRMPSMTNQGALACGLVLMFAAAVPALPTATKKHHHRSLEPSILHDGVDSDEAPDLERAHVAKVKSFDAAKGLEHARKERAHARERHAAEKGAHRADAALEHELERIELERRFEGAEHRMIGTEAFQMVLEKGLTASFREADLERKMQFTTQALAASDSATWQQVMKGAIEQVTRDFPGVEDYGSIVALSGDYIGSVHPVSVDAYELRSTTLTKKDHKMIRRKFSVLPEHAGARQVDEDGVGKVLGQSCTANGDNDAMCEPYNKVWEALVHRCARRAPLSRTRRPRSSRRCHASGSRGSGLRPSSTTRLTGSTRKSWG